MRRIVTSLLAVLLLCGSSCMSLCDLSCQLQPMQLAASSPMDHAAMSMTCEHCRDASRVVAASTCGTMHCSPALLLRARAKEAASSLLAGHDQLLAVQGVPLLSGVVSIEGWRRNPPGQFVVFPPPLVSLRI